VVLLIGRKREISECPQPAETKIMRSTPNLQRRLKRAANLSGTLLVDLFHHLALFAIGATTVWSAVVSFAEMVQRGHANLSDILLLFIYLEIGAMIGIYFRTTRLPVRYLLYIAITVLARVLIEMVSAEHQTGYDILIVAGAILVLSVAVLILGFGSHNYPDERPGEDAAKV
jgi:phosphate starvation-inducible membrane PsiE